MKLSDVCFEMHQGINTVADKVKYYECGTPILQSKNITNGILDLEDVRFVNENDYNKYKEKYIPHKGNILLSNIGTIGKSLLIEEEKNFLIAWNIFLIKVNESKINSKFLNFYFQYLDMSNYYNKYLTGGTVKFINKKTMENIEIPNISLVNQIEIANKLEKVQKMIDIRKKQIEELDKLIKSQFVGMFGTPFNNDKWEIKKLGDIANSITDGSNVDTKYYKGGGEVLFLRIQNVWRNEFRLEDLVYISKEVNKKYFDTSLHTGDLLISKIGRYYTKDSSLGRVSIYRGENDMANYSNNVMRIRLKPEYNSEFINIVLNLDDYQQHIRRESKGGTDKRALSKKIIENFPIINPPIEIQIKYIEFVKLIDKQKFEIQKSLEETQKLQESLMNKYFGE